jgi:hypothetical protein
LKQTDVSEVHTASIVALMMEAVHTSEMLVYFNESTRHYIPEGCHLLNPWKLEFVARIFIGVYGIIFIDNIVIFLE